jgi:hypothetical protein
MAWLAEQWLKPKVEPPEQSAARLARPLAELTDEMAAECFLPYQYRRKCLAVVLFLQT